jgi:hypothetical protein
VETAGDAGPSADRRVDGPRRPTGKRGECFGHGTRRPGHGTGCPQGRSLEGEPAVGVRRVAVQGADRDLAAADRARVHGGRRQASTQGTDVHGNGSVAVDQSAIESADQGDRPRDATNSRVRHSGRGRRGPVPGFPGSPGRDPPLLRGPLVPRAAGDRVRLRADRAGPGGRYSRLQQSGDLGRLGAVGPAHRDRASAERKHRPELGPRAWHRPFASSAE